MASGCGHALGMNAGPLPKALASYASSLTRIPPCTSSRKSCFIGLLPSGGTRLGSLKAVQFTGIEPDLPEYDFEDTRTAGDGEEHLFEYGIADGHHTFHKKDANVDTWEAFKEPFIEAGGPSGFQAFLAWGTLPALLAMVWFGVQVEYVFLAFVLFVFAFIGLEMDKPVQDHEFPPEIYMERRKKRMENITE
ncbi:hypothetical protein KP509_14G064300 [Ceratopteris richardii]|uniref:Uncharacterized protein n=1 Tax=Ceratopteris richardii TaxID=49495 RepID=A0A8T2T8P7_CERRI|nr:hypothetical protein KP509_14G064300 [Ceratopteris richardii]